MNDGIMRQAKDGEFSPLKDEASTMTAEQFAAKYAHGHVEPWGRQPYMAVRVDGTDYLWTASDGRFDGWDRPMDNKATIDDFRLDDKEALVDLLLKVQAGLISCRRMASEIVKRVPPNNRVTVAALPRTVHSDGSATGSFPNASKNLPDDPAERKP